MQQEKLVMYTGPECSLCVSAKGIIQNKGIEVEIIEVDPKVRKGRDIMMEKGIMGVPVLDMIQDNGGNRFIGPKVIEFLESL